MPRPYNFLKYLQKIKNDTRTSKIAAKHDLGAISDIHFISPASEQRKKKMYAPCAVAGSRFVKYITCPAQFVYVKNIFFRFSLSEILEAAKSG